MKKVKHLLIANTLIVFFFSSCSDDSDGPPTPIVNSVTLADVSNFGDSRDMEVSFSKVSDESLISEYRIVVVKSANAGSFTLAQADELAAERFTTAIADNTNKKFTLTQGAKDSDGATIVEDQSYVAFVITVGKSGNDELSEASNALSLILPATPVVGSVTLSDISNFGDGRDLKVIFSKVADESLISEYRIIITKSSAVSSLNLSTATALPVTSFTVAAKTESDQDVTLNLNTKDSNGDLIMQDNQYGAFVLTMGAGRNSGQNKLSGVSTILTLEIPSAPPATSVSAVDVANNGNGKDIEIKFNKASNENLVSGYRAIVVRETSAPAFNLVTTENLTADRYQAVSKTGTNQQLELTPGLLDSEGNGIQESINYKVFILAVADGQVAGKNSLSSASNSITLLQKNAVRTFAVFPNAGTGGMQVDNSGNVYFGDFGLTTAAPGTTVQKITPNGTASVFVSGMMAADGNDFDSNGNFYSVSWVANQIIKVTPSGTRTIFASGGLINGPIGIAVDNNNNLFVTNYNVNTVIKITAAGVVSAFSSSSLFNGPNGIDIDVAGNIYVSNFNNSNVIKLDKDNGNGELFVTTPGGGNNAHLVIKNDIIYVAGRTTHRIFKVTLAKVVSVFLGTGAAGSLNGSITGATISWPNDIAFNSDGTKMYISTSAGSSEVFGPAIIKEVSIVE